VLSGYDRGFVWKDNMDASPRLHFVGITSEGVVKYSYSYDGGTTWSTAVQIATGATVVQPTGITTHNARLCVIFHKGTEEVMYASDDGGQTWSEV